MKMISFISVEMTHHGSMDSPGIIAPPARLRACRHSVVVCRDVCGPFHSGSISFQSNGLPGLGPLPGIQETPSAAFARSAIVLSYLQTSSTSQAQPRDFVHALASATQVSPQALPLSQTLQHAERCVHGRTGAEVNMSQAERRTSTNGTKRMHRNLS